MTQITTGYDVPFPPCIRVSDLARLVEKRAYEIFEERGCHDGCAIDDWVQAERETLGHARANLFEEETGFAVDFRLPGFQPEHIDVRCRPSKSARPRPA